MVRKGRWDGWNSQVSGAMVRHVKLVQRECGCEPIYFLEWSLGRSRSWTGRLRAPGGRTSMRNQTRSSGLRQREQMPERYLRGRA